MYELFVSDLLFSSVHLDYHTSNPLVSWEVEEAIGFFFAFFFFLFLFFSFAGGGFSFLLFFPLIRQGQVLLR